MSKKAIAFGQHLCSIDRPEILPDLILRELMRFYGVRKGILRLWNLEPKFQNLKVAVPVSPLVQAQISSMKEPYSGENFGTEIAEWTNSRPEETGGVFLAPFFNPEGMVFGFLCLTASSPKPFSAKDKSAFIVPALEFAQASLMRLQQ